MDVDVKVESEEDPDVESAVEMLVSTVVAWEDGQQGLTQIKKFRQTTGYVKTENGYLNYASANSKFSIKCKDCGESFLKAKVRWSADYTKEGHKFYCPECIIKRDKIEVGTTLIMLPESLCHQWYEEIKRHVREDVKIDIYLGVATEGYKNPIYLSKFDIILCPFEIMIKEFSYSTNMNNANIRKNYGGMRLISPLLSINWWRLVLDESQMVDKNHKRVLKVCNQLSAEHRICVTGTPLVDSIHDIYSSAALLGIYPINYPHTFNLLMWNTFTNGKKSFLINFLKQIFWRNTKASVAAQLELSTIKENVIEMHFTPLEESLYRQELKSAREKMNTLITSLGVNYLTKLSSLPNKTLLNMMSVLHNLRLSLTTGGSHHRQANKTVDEFACFTPEVLFERLFQSARNSLEESLRATIMNLNCMSGLTAIINKPKSLPIYQAASQLIEEMAEFNKVLQVHKENSTTFKPVTVDTTQSYHVYKNMADIMTDVDATKYANEIVGCRLKEKDQVKYMIRKAIPPAMDKIDQWNKILSNFELFDKDFSYTYQWFAIGMDYFLDQGDIGEEILVATYLRGYQTVFDRIQRQPLTMSNVYFQVVNHLKEQNAKIKLLREDFDFLREGLLNTDTFFESPWFTETMECNHNQFLLNSTTKEQKALDELVEAEAGPLPKSRRDRTQNEVPKKRYLFSCPMCEMRKKVEEVEYFITTKNDKGERCDPGKVSHLSTICNEIFSRLPSRVTSKVIQSKKSLTKWIRTSRQFCEVLEKVLDSAQDFVSAIRELKQAGTRFSYGMTANIPDVNFRGTTTSVVLTPEVMWTLRPTIIMMKQNVEDSSSVVKRDKTRMQYISSLRSNDGNEKRDCPVCYSRIKYEWFVFPCAHIICTSCFKSYEKLIGQMLKCVTCRLGCKKSSVFLVNQRTSEDRESPSAIPGKQLPLKFNRLLLTIQEILKEKQQNKILIFTSMNSALQPLSDLFKMANLQYALMTAKNTSQALLDFRNGSFPILVIPLSLGANGLNLTQANHVIFLEPITTTSIVSQAIARVHRMGQYRPVTIHHLIISGTIEEEIFNIAKGGLDEDGWTIETLVNLLHN